MSSDIREGIAALERGPRLRAGPVRRGGLLDLLLVVAMVLVAGSRTPVGGLGWYALEKVRGHDAALPSLTAYFSSGAMAPPSGPDLPVLPPESGDWMADGGLPEPWRSAARAVLAEAELPAATRALALERSAVADAESALAALDALYVESGDPEAALETLALGPDQRSRAIQRARAAGDPDPERYESHRRYLPAGAAHDGDRIVGSALALATALDLQWPLAGDPRISSPYGNRLHPVLKEWKLHNGIDLAVPVGTEVFAAQGGTVAVIGENDRSGIFAVLDHGHGIRTAYCHLSEMRATKGEVVERGDVFAISGNTGRSTGPHLHFIVRIAGKTVDPMRFHRPPVGDS